MDRKLRICYFAEKDSIHIWRWLDYFHDGGHEVFLYCGFGTGFKRWPVSVADRSECVPDIMMRPAPINVPQSVSRWKPLYSAFRPVYSRIIGVFNKSRELALLARRLRSQLAQVNPDVVHALWLWDNALYAHTAGFHPYVITPLGSDIWDVDAYSKGKSSRFRHMLRSADAVTADAIALGCLSALGCQGPSVSPDRGPRH